MASTSEVSALIELPRPDGYLEVGIAAGIDPALTEEDNIPIHGTSTRDVYNSAVAWAMTKTFRDDGSNLLFTSGVATIVGCGMLRSRNNVPDGDWYEAAQANLLTSEQRTLFMESPLSSCEDK
jgi:hypothetical protein